MWLVLRPYSRYVASLVPFPSACSRLFWLLQLKRGRAGRAPAGAAIGSSTVKEHMRGVRMDKATLTIGIIASAIHSMSANANAGAAWRYVCPLILRAHMRFPHRCLKSDKVPSSAASSPRSKVLKPIDRP